MRTFFIFDVESCGLHGEGFAVGYVVIDETGKTLEEGLFSSPMPSPNEWVEANVLPALPLPNCITTLGVRCKFWEIWTVWKLKGALMVADCAWPVEARFLEQCVSDDLPTREWQGPYPLHDLATLLLISGRYPLTHFEREENELPAHNPLNDARQSARLFVHYHKLKSQ